MYYLFPFIFFFGMGMMYLAIMVMFQDAIDYNEYEYGERKESIISAWRPLDVKLSSALLRGFQFLIFLIAGLDGAVSAISDAEKAHNVAAQGHIGEKNWVDLVFIQQVIDIKNGTTATSIRIAGILVVVILVAAVVAAYLLMHLGYKITEERHVEIVAELDKRHQEAEQAEAAAQQEVQQAQ